MKILALLETSDNGMNIRVSTYNMSLTAAIYEYYAGWCDKFSGETYNTPEALIYTLKEPLGVCAGILPWNFPFFLAASKLAPALAMGNTFILKPSEKTPLTALKLGELCIEAGVPPGVVNVLPGYGDVGAALSAHKDIDKISFTGSVGVGRKIMTAAAQSNLKKVSLELGGKSPHIVFDDANVDAAVAITHNGLFLHQGQVCVAGSRVFVQDGIYDEFVKKAAARAKSRTIGSPLNPKSNIGPIVDDIQFNRVMQYIETGKREGARIVAGGEKVEGKEGFYIQPTVFADVQDDMKICKEEIFGPVMTVIRFKTLKEVITRANKTTFGLAAGIITNDVKRAHKVARELKAGTVWINTYGTLDKRAPFGGYKESGIGRESGIYALHEYSQVKTVYSSML
eukprot:TRINITY_DN13240_c0_g1_i1.p1 TRINITY_DN13240_c0_g1~~TRINITY_DN13240_c0_g1_i1.p1  ORF type:complete len:456 (+),score=89.03 TRINITY_DN13240_c0_g1_i1:180-1370(+)